MHRPITMLVADDSDLSQRLLSDAACASNLPLRISTAGNGRDCLIMLNNSNFDVAFIDAHMPELSSTEAVWPATKRVGKTFVTLIASPPAAQAVDIAVKLRAYEFLFRPFAVGDVLAILENYARISSPAKVLVVDDSTAVRQVVQRIVQGSVFDCEIAEAGDGEAALTLCRGSHFDVVFLGCNMPGSSGLATTKQLAAVQPPLKVIMISGDRNAATEDEALEAGACAVLHTPFNSLDVDQVLHAAFGLRSPNLKVKSSAPNFDVAIEGSTIRVAHRPSGHMFEYLWCEKPPYLRNGVVRQAAGGAVVTARVAAVAEKTALLQLRSARLLAAA